MEEGGKPQSGAGDLGWAEACPPVEGVVANGEQARGALRTSFVQLGIHDRTLCGNRS